MKPEEYRAARERLGLTQEQLAERLERHSSIISKRERGVKPILMEAVLAIRELERAPVKYVGEIRGDTRVSRQVESRERNEG